MKASSVTRRAILWLGLPTILLSLVVLIWRESEISPKRSALEALSELDLPRYRSSYSPKNKSDDAQARYEYELVRQRSPATGFIPLGMRARELAHARSLPKAEERAWKAGGLAAQQWTFLGPTNVGGRTRAVAVDLDYNGTSNRRILAGGISGGMFISEDDGQSWTLTSSLSEMASVTCLAQDPSNRSVWYYGTGELLGNSAGGLGGAYHGHGIFKSTDGGRTWSPLQSTREGNNPTLFDDLFDYVWNIKVHPGGAVFAATFGAIFRSTNGGTSWSNVLGRTSDQENFSAMTDVAIAANGDVYAALSRNGGGNSSYGVYRSTNGGDSWERITPGGLVNDPYRMVLATAPSDANTAYLLVQSNEAGAAAGDHQFFRHNRATGNWADLSSSLPNETGAEGNASFGTQGGYDQMVSVKPDDANVVFVGGVNLYRSTDGGASHTRIGGYASPANYQMYTNQHPDQHALVFFPGNPNMAISGHDGGLSKSTNIMAQPHAWQLINNGYTTTQFYSVAMDPQPGGLTVIGGLQDNGNWGMDGTVVPAPWVELPFGGDGAHSAVAPGGGTFFISTQNGTTFRLKPPSGAALITPANANQFLFINPFALDPNDSRVMYMGEAGGLWRNSNLDEIPDGGFQPTAINWTFLNASARAGSRTTAVAVAKTPANRVYFATSDFNSQMAVVRLDDAAANGSGTLITPPVATAGFAPFPSSIAINPNDGNEVIVTFSNYHVQSIWHSTNAGSSWTNVEGNLLGETGPSVRSAAIVPTQSGTLYLVGTSTGIFSTSNLSGTGTIWAIEGANVLGNVVVDMIVARPEDGTIIAGTHGRGVYRAVVGEGSSVAAAAVNVNSLQIEVQPGSTQSTTFTLTNAGGTDLDFNFGAVGKTQTTASVHRLQPDPTLRRPSEQAGKTDPRAGGPQPGRAEATVNDFAMSALASGDFLILDDGSDAPDTFLGWGDGFTSFQWGNRFYAPVGGFSLESFHVYMRSESFPGLPVSVFITDPQANVFASGTVNLPASAEGQWYQITFSPIALPEGQVFDIELIAPGGILYPAGVDANGQVTGSSFFWVDTGFTGYYESVSVIEGLENGAWLIRAEGTASGGSLNQPPVASIVASRTQAIPNETITFDGSGSRDTDGTITQYAWSFGDGTTGNQATVQHAYAQTGVYTVTLTVTDNEGATGQATTQITVSSSNQAPTATIVASKIQAEVNEEIAFDGTGSSDPDGNITAYSWEFGDGTTSTGPTASHAYAQAGNYTVRLTVTDDEGANGQSTVQVSILAEPSRLTVTPTSGKLGPGESRVITVTYDATNQVSGQYTGQIILNSNGGNVSIPVTIRVDPTVDVEPGPELAERFVLDQNYPNPFNPRTTIEFSLDQTSHVRLTVFDVNGRAVRTLLDANRTSGSHRVAWEGDDVFGRPVASGTYFYRLETVPSPGEAASHFTRKMVLVR